MIRSKIIHIIIAAFGGLAFQTHTNDVNAQSATLYSGATLHKGFAIQTGNDHVLVMQWDNNLVLYNPSGTPIWATGSWNCDGFGNQLLSDCTGVNTLTMQSDGNLVLSDYDLFGNPGIYWDSATGGNPGAFLNVQDDGNLVVYQYGSTTETANNALWASGTYGQ
jgi:hypothetical protein